MTAPRCREFISGVCDNGSWLSWDEPMQDPEPIPDDYGRDLESARRRTGLDESLVTGECRIGGRRVALAVSEFAFLGGSIGIGAAGRLVRAIERATAERLPLLAAPASGGTRMQEGAVAFAQMIKITAAVTMHKSAGLPYLVYLRHPTTGGVVASWGSLGHITIAEPGALIGFLGPRVQRALGSALPSAVQTAENLHAHGLIDAVLDVDSVGPYVKRVLDLLDNDGTAHNQVTAKATTGKQAQPQPDVRAWTSVRYSRRRERPGIRELLDAVANEVTPLRGAGAPGHASGMWCALARVGPVPCVVLGHDRNDRLGALGPEAFREARRSLRLASELRLPVVTVIDTPGAAPSREAEEGGLAGEIARCLAEMLSLPVPTVCLMLGEGAGGAALALLPADRVVAAQHAWLAPLAPEGASALVHRTTEKADDVADAQRIRSLDLFRDGVVDEVVAEQPDATREPDAFLARARRALEANLVAVVRQEPHLREQARLRRYRMLGETTA